MARGVKIMANSLLETCNDWQILRAEILARNPNMAMTLQRLDIMIEHSVRAAIEISHRVDWDFSEAERKVSSIMVDSPAAGHTANHSNSFFFYIGLVYFFNGVLVSSYYNRRIIDVEEQDWLIEQSVLHQISL